MLLLSFFIEITPIPWRAVVTNMVVISLFTLVAVVMTSRGAHRIQKEIDALDSL